MKRPTILWIAALLLGWLFDFLFWGHAPGISFAIYVALCLIGGFAVLRLEGFRPSWRALLLLIPMLFFAAMTFVRQEGMSGFLSFASTLFLMAVLAVTYLGGRWLKYSLPDYVVNFFKLAGSVIARPVTFLVENKKRAASVALATGQADRQAGAGTLVKGPGWKRFWAVFRGVLIAIPIVAIFAALLSSADIIFAKRLDEFMQLFRLEKLPEYIFRGIYILVGAYALAGVFLHAAQRSRDEKLLNEEKPLVPSFLGFTEAAVVLGAVVVLFGIFVAIQFQYFFGGQANINYEGYTYSEYARRGFGELVTVAFFSLLLFLGLSAVTKRQSQVQRLVFSGLGIAVVALVGVILFSAFQRLMLYEAAYGFSRLRTYTHIFMFWLGGLLAAVVVLEVWRKERAFAIAAVLAALGFTLTLNLLNVDGFIARQNVARAVQGEDLDVPYLVSLSDDSIPALVEQYRSAGLPDDAREAVGAVLVCVQRGMSGGQPDTNWRSFTLSRWWSVQAMQSVEGDLKDYQLVDEEREPEKVVTPSGEEYNCWMSGMD